MQKKSGFMPAGKLLSAASCFLSITLFTFLLASCSESPTSIGSDLVQDDNINVSTLNSSTDALSQRSSLIKRAIPLYGSQTLLLGSAGNAEAGILIDFYISMPDTFLTGINNNQINIISSTLKLKRIYAIGDTANRTNLRFSVYKVNTQWSSLFTADTLSSLDYNHTNISSNLKVTDTLTTLSIDNNTIISLMKDSVSGKYTGFYLKPDPGQTVALGYQSLYNYSNVTEVPLLEVVYARPGVYQDTVTFLPESDISVVTGSLPASGSENMFVQSGVAINSRLWFDLSRIPPNSVINNATLTLSVDSLNSLTGSAYQNSLSVYALLDTISLDSVGTSVTLSRSGSTFTGNATSVIQSLYQKINYGMLITTSGEYQGLELFALKSSTASDPALRPQLKIIYTNKK